MKKIISFIGSQLKVILAVAIGTVVGGLTTVGVMAAIPDPQGVIHGCIRSNNENLRIIDSATQTCGAAQTPLNFDQMGGSRAYALLDWDPNTHTHSLNAERTKNVQAYQPAGNGWGGSCFVVAIEPKTMSVAWQTSGGFHPEVEVKSATTGWSNPTWAQFGPEEVELACQALPGANAYTAAWGSPYFVTFN